MRTVSFQAELGIHEGFDTSKNGRTGIGKEELGKVLQQLQQLIEDRTGIYISTVVSGPNRSCYKPEIGCPSGGEISYTIHGVADARLQLREEQWAAVEWKKAVILLMNELKTWFSQQYMEIEFTDDKGTDAYLLSPDVGIEDCFLELDAKP